MNSLSEIYGKFPRCDKGSFHSYIDVYQDLLAPYRRPGIRMVEIGLRYPDSLQMWSEYFSEGSVFGVDIEQSQCLSDLKAHGYHVAFLDSRDSRCPFVFGTSLPFDVVVDDGSHVFGDQVVTYLNFRRNLSATGIYVIEDIQDIDANRGVLEQLHPGHVQIVDRRSIKGRFDDVLAVIQ